MFYCSWSYCDFYNISQPHILKIIAQKPNWVKNRYPKFSSISTLGATLTLEYLTKLPIYYVYAINPCSLNYILNVKMKIDIYMQSELEKGADTVINIVP